MADNPIAAIVIKLATTAFSIFVVVYLIVAPPTIPETTDLPGFVVLANDEKDGISCPDGMAETAMADLRLAAAPNGTLTEASLRTLIWKAWTASATLPTVPRCAERQDHSPIAPGVLA